MKEIIKKINYKEIEELLKKEKIDVDEKLIKEKILELFSDIIFLYNNNNKNPFVAWKWFAFLIDDNQLFLYLRKGKKIIKYYKWDIVAD